MTIEMREVDPSALSTSATNEMVKGAVALPPATPTTEKLPPVKKAAERSGTGQAVVGNSYNPAGFATGTAGAAVPFPAQQRRVYASYSASKSP